MNKIKAYNYRQIKIMENKIDKLRKHSITFPDFIDDLEATFNCLQIPNENKELLLAFQGYWLNLESVYANAAYEDRESLDQHDMQLITEALQNIEKLINAYKKENFTEDDILQFEYIDK